MFGSVDLWASYHRASYRFTQVRFCNSTAGEVFSISCLAAGIFVIERTFNRDNISTDVQVMKQKQMERSGKKIKPHICIYLLLLGGLLRSLGY